MLVDQAVVHVGGVQVHRADPRHRRLAERQQEVAHVALAGAILAPGEGVLRDEDRLLHAPAGERRDLGDDVAERAAPVPAPELRDRTECAPHVAALGDLHVGVRHARLEEPRRGGVVEVARRSRGRPVVPARGLADQVDDPVKLGGAEDRVHFRQLGQDLPAVALGQAARDDQRPAAAAPLQLGELEDRVHRFLAGAVDEGAGVDDHALGVFGALGEREPGRGQHAEHELGVDLVLRAAEGGQVHAHHGDQL